MSNDAAVLRFRQQIRQTGRANASHLKLSEISTVISTLGLSMEDCYFDGSCILTHRPPVKVPSRRVVFLCTFSHDGKKGAEGYHKWHINIPQTNVVSRYPSCPACGHRRSVDLVASESDPVVK